MQDDRKKSLPDAETINPGNTNPQTPKPTSTTVERHVDSNVTVTQTPDQDSPQNDSDSRGNKD
jgi:hypothetical protein